MRLNDYNLLKFKNLRTIHEEGATVAAACEKALSQFPPEVQSMFCEPSPNQWDAFCVYATATIGRATFEQVCHPDAFVVALWDDGKVTAFIQYSQIVTVPVNKHFYVIYACNYHHPLSNDDVQTLISIGKIYVEQSTSTEARVLCRV